MNINERLQDMKTFRSSNSLEYRMTKIFKEDYQWMHDTIKQQQERIAELERDSLALSRIGSAWVYVETSEERGESLTAGDFYNMAQDILSGEDDENELLQKMEDVK